MDTISNISKQTSDLTIFNYVFHFGVQEHGFITSLENTPFWHQQRDICVFISFIETCSWKSNMKHIVKYDFCLNILLMIVQKWASNSKQDIYTRAYLGPGPIRTPGTGHPKQYISQCTQYLTPGVILDFQEQIFRTVRKNTLFWRRLCQRPKGGFEDLNIDMFLEVQNETCS